MLAIAHALANREVARCGGEIAHWHCRCRHGHEAAQRGAGDHTDGESFHGTLPIGSARPVTSPATLNWHEWYPGRRPPDVRYPTQKPSRNISRWPHVLGRALWATTNDPADLERYADG